jgi:hypothetical protein
MENIRLQFHATRPSRKDTSLNYKADWADQGGIPETVEEMISFWELGMGFEPG